MTRAKRQQVVIAWVGIGAAWAAAVVLEILLLSEGATIAVGLTTATALIAVTQLTRRIAAVQRRASITVEDLRATRRI